MTCAFCGFRDATCVSGDENGKKFPCCAKCDSETEPHSEKKGVWIDGNQPLAQRVIAFARRWQGRTVGEIRDGLELNMCDQDRIAHALLRATKQGYLIREGKRGAMPGTGYTYRRGPVDWKPGMVRPVKRAA